MVKQAMKWVSNIVSVLMLLILIILIYYTVSSKMNGGKPHIFGYEMLTVLSGSMEPGIPTGSVIGVKPVEDTASLQVGDVITFKANASSDMLITHRIIEVQGEGNSLQFITRGDNNDARDPDPVLASNVVAKYENIVIPYIGYLFSFSKTKLGIILLMIFPGAILILSQIISVIRMIVKMDDTTAKADQQELEQEKPPSVPGENFS